MAVERGDILARGGGRAVVVAVVVAVVGGAKETNSFCDTSDIFF